MANARKPLSLYAEHAGISIEAARKRLKRLGIDYLHPFSFEDADRRFLESRHAHRASSIDMDEDDDDVADETKKHPKFIESQARREKFKADLTEIEFHRQAGRLILASDVDREWFRIGRIVRDTLKNIGPRLRAQLAEETDASKCEQILDEEIERSLEVLNEQIMALDEVA